MKTVLAKLNRFICITTILGIFSSAQASVDHLQKEFIKTQAKLWVVGIRAKQHRDAQITQSEETNTIIQHLLSQGDSQSKSYLYTLGNKKKRQNLTETQKKYLELLACQRRLSQALRVKKTEKREKGVAKGNTFGMNKKNSRGNKRRLSVSPSQTAEVNVVMSKMTPRSPKSNSLPFVEKIPKVKRKRLSKTKKEEKLNNKGIKKLGKQKTVSVKEKKKAVTSKQVSEQLEGKPAAFRVFYVGVGVIFGVLLDRIFIESILHKLKEAKFRKNMKKSDKQ